MYNLTIQSLRRRIVVFAVASVLLTGIVVATVALWPMRMALREGADQGLRFTATMKAEALQQYARGLASLARQVTSRTRIRQELATYNRGKIPLSQLVDFTAPKLKDAMALAPEIAGITRLDAEGQAVVTVGHPVPRALWRLPEDSVMLVGPAPLGEGPAWLLAAAPIRDREGRQEGTDLLLFGTGPLSRLLEEEAGSDAHNFLVTRTPDGAIARVYAPGPDGVTETPGRGVRAAVVAGGALAAVTCCQRGSSVAAVMTVPPGDWTLVRMVPAGTLYAGVGRSVALVGAAVVVLLVAAGATVVWLLHSLTGMMLVRTLDLEQQVATLKTTRDALERDRAALADSNAELEQFAYVASHDMKEPLRTITNFLGLLERRHGAALPREAQEYVSHAVTGARRMRAVIDDLLAYSRVALDDRHRTVVDLKALVTEIQHHDLASRLKEAEATLTVGVLPTVTGDPSQLRLLFLNLLENALKYRAPDRAPVVAVQAEELAVGWHLTVQDNGQGIPPSYRNQVFEMFRRLHGPDSYPGTGIGLAVCRRVVERHGGRVWITGVDENDPGAGTVFHLLLPDAVRT